MNKQELMENKTMEQLAEMIVKYQRDGKIKNPEIQINCPVCGTPFEFDDGKERFYMTVLTDTIQSLEEENEKLKNASEVKNDEIQKLKWNISNLEESNGRLQAKVDTYTDYLLPRCTKEAKELIGHNHFAGVRIVSIDEMKDDCGKEDEIDRPKSQLDRKQTEINQIDEILNELFGVTHDVAKPAEFERILKEKAESYKTISDFLSEEPIEVASMLIKVQGEYENNPIAKAFCGTDKRKYNLFDISELRQIAEHLLVYCNANGEGEE